MWICVNFVTYPQPLFVVALLATTQLFQLTVSYRGLLFCDNKTLEESFVS